MNESEGARSGETEHEAAVRRGHLYEKLAALVEEHGVDDVAFILGVLFGDLADARAVMEIATKAAPPAAAAEYSAGWPAVSDAPCGACGTSDCCEHCPRCGATDPWDGGDGCDVCLIARDEAVERLESAAGWDPSP